MYIFRVTLTPDIDLSVLFSAKPEGVLCVFVWQIYLLMGYYYTATEEYDIKWTMPHCVLTLKLIGMMLLIHLLLLKMYIFTN